MMNFKRLHRIYLFMLNFYPKKTGLLCDIELMQYDITCLAKNYDNAEQTADRGQYVSLQV